MPRFVRATPDPAGGYTFDRDDGPPLYLWGPEADAMAAELPGPLSSAFGGGMAEVSSGGAGGAGGMEESPSVPDVGRVEGGMGAGGMSPPEGIGGASGLGAGLPPPRRSVASPSSGGGGEGAAGMSDEPPAEAPPLGVAAAPVAAPVEVAPVVPAGTDWSALGGDVVRYGGSPGVDPERLAREGRPVPTTVSEQIEGAVPYSPEDAEARADLSINLQLAQQAQADRAVVAELSAAAVERARLPRLMQQAAKAESFAAEVERGYRADRADMDRLLAAQRERKIDAKRVFRGTGGALAGIAAVLAQAIGAYGATLSGGPNYAQQIVNKVIDDDIREQEAELARGQGEVDNAIGQLQRRFGDMEQSKAALRMLMHDAAESEGREMAALARTQKAVADFDLWKAENDIARQTAEEGFVRASVGKHTMNVASKIVQPKAPTRGGVRPMTLAERTKAAKLRAEGAEAEAKQISYETTGAAPEPAAARARREEKAAAQEEKRAAMEVPGEGFARTKEAAADRIAKRDARAALVANLAKVQALRTQAGTYLPGGVTGSAAALESALADTLVAYKDAKGLGALDKGVQEVAAGIFGEAAQGTGMKGIVTKLTGTFDAKIAATKQRVIEEDERHRKSVIATPAAAGAGGGRKSVEVR